MFRTRRLAALLAAAGLTVAGCGSGGTSEQADAGSEDELSGEIHVFAAASLTDSFKTIKKDFESENPDVEVTYNFGPSSGLAKQIQEGSPADVFASAAPKQMKQLTDAKEVTDEATTFVTNTLEIAVPKGNPGKIKALSDFADEDKKIALCAKEVPCGSAAQEVFKLAKIKAAPDSYEKDVKATTTKVSLGEVDAALVYKTDVLAAGEKVEGIEFPEAKKAINDYPIATTAKSENPDAAKAFVDYVQSEKGLAVLTKAGFATP